MTRVSEKWRTCSPPGRAADRMLGQSAIARAEMTHNRRRDVSMHPELNLKLSIRPGLDILANEIVIALKKRTRFPTNGPVYSPGLVVPAPGQSLLRYELGRVESIHAELGRYTFASQKACVNSCTLLAMSISLASFRGRVHIFSLLGLNRSLICSTANSPALSWSKHTKHYRNPLATLSSP